MQRPSINIGSLGDHRLEGRLVVGTFAWFNSILGTCPVLCDPLVERMIGLSIFSASSWPSMQEGGRNLSIKGFGRVPDSNGEEDAPPRIPSHGPDGSQLHIVVNQHRKCDTDT